MSTTWIPGNQRGVSPRAELPTRAVIERIVLDGDPLARDEMVAFRRLFRFGQEGPLVLADFLAALRKSRRGEPGTVVDSGYDLVLERFARLPGEANAEGGLGRDTQLKQSGTDCRHHYRGFLQWSEPRLAKHARPGSIAVSYTHLTLPTN